MKTLIFLPNYIGDILMTTPAIRMLKLFIPGNKIYCMINSKYRELLDENVNIYKLIEKTKKINMIEQLRKEHFDIIILFRTTFNNVLLTIFLNPKYSVGLREDFSNLFIKKTFRKDFARPYRQECLILIEDVLKQFNINYKINSGELKNLDFYGWDKTEIKNSVERILIENDIDSNKPLIVINPVSTRDTKNLTVGQSITVIKILQQRLKEYEIVLVGSENNLSFTNYILKDVFVKSLVGKLSLKQLAYLLSRTKVFVSPDTGPAFVAQAVKCNTVIIFTSTSPDKYAPYSDNVKYYYSPLICSPCYKNFCKEKDKNRCILQIEPEKIIDLIEEML